MPVIQSVKVDWFRVLTDLTRAGCSLQQIADELDISKSTLLGWKQGASPRHHSGEALIELWCRIKERDRSDLPVYEYCRSFVSRPLARIKVPS